MCELIRFVLWSLKMVNLCRQEMLMEWGGGVRGLRNSLVQDRYRERKHSESKDQRRRLCYMGVGLRGAEWKDGGGG